MSSHTRVSHAQALALVRPWAQDLLDISASCKHANIKKVLATRHARASIVSHFLDVILCPPQTEHAEPHANQPLRIRVAAVLAEIPHIIASRWVAELALVVCVMAEVALVPAVVPMLLRVGHGVAGATNPILQPAIAPNVGPNRLAFPLVVDAQIQGIAVRHVCPSTVHALVEHGFSYECGQVRRSSNGRGNAGALHKRTDLQHQV
mmetsp:Transcript_101352/g.275486  ORF Transcript_101352/g.275486 Transcript_101352/m.275486 type:complete len:206 (+) Transcript_101352:1863-2480(+)